MLGLGAIMTGAKAFVGGIKGAQDGGGLKGFVTGAKDQLLGNNVNEDLASQVEANTEKLNAMQSGESTAVNATFKDGKRIGSAVNPIPATNPTTPAEVTATGQTPAFGSPNFAEPGASVMNAVSDPNQPTPPLPFYGNKQQTT